MCTSIPASTRLMPVPPSSSQRCLQALPRGPWGAKLPLVENYCTVRKDEEGKEAGSYWDPPLGLGWSQTGVLQIFLGRAEQ